MAERKGLVGRVSNLRFLLVLVLIGVYAGGTTYYVLGDTSVRGLTVKIFYVSRSCSPNSGLFGTAVSYDIEAGVWSTHSMRTTISNVKFTLFADGVNLGTVDGGARSFDPGKSAGFTLKFNDPHLDPHSLPSSSTLVLTISASVGAGLSSSSLTRSDSLVQAFQSTSC